MHIYSLCLLVLVTVSVANGSRTRRKREAKQDLDKIIDDLINSMDDKKDASLKASLEKAKEFAGSSEVTAEQLGQLAKSASEIKAGLKTMTNGDSKAIGMLMIHAAQAGVTLMGAMGAMGPFAGALSSILGVMGGIVGRGGKVTMGQVVQSVVREELNFERYTNLMNEISGTLNELSDAHSYISGKLDTPVKDWTQTDVNGLASHVGVLRGSKELGKILGEIDRNRKEKPNEWKETVNLMAGYVRILNLKNLVSFMVIAIHKQTEFTNASGGGISRVMIDALINAQGAFKWVLEPSDAEAQAAISIDREKTPELYIFLKGLKLDPETSQNTLKGKCVNLKNIHKGYILEKTSHPVIGIGANGVKAEDEEFGVLNAVETFSESDPYFFNAMFQFSDAGDGWLKLEHRIKSKSSGELIGQGYTKWWTNGEGLRTVKTNDDKSKFKVIKTSTGKWYWIIKQSFNPIWLLDSTNDGFQIAGVAPDPKFSEWKYWDMSDCKEDAIGGQLLEAG